MKYIKTYEEREFGFKYLSEDDEIKMEKLILKILPNWKVEKKVSELTFKDFVNNDFDNMEIFIDIITGSDYNTSIYKEIDRFASKNIEGNMVKLRNSVHNIFEKIYYQYRYDGIIDNKLISILEDKPSKYKERFESYGDMFSEKVKDATEYLLNAEKYNI